MQISQLINSLQWLHNLSELKNLLMRLSFREGRSNAHIKGDYQRIGDVMLKNLQGLKVWQLFMSNLYMSAISDEPICHLLSLSSL